MLLIFHVFSSCSRGPFLEGPGADLYRKIRFGCHFRFSGFAKRHLFDTIFVHKGCKGAWFRSAASLPVSLQRFGVKINLNCKTSSKQIQQVNTNGPNGSQESILGLIFPHRGSHSSIISGVRLQTRTPAK